MVNHYEKLFKISIQHDAYPPGISNSDFAIHPSLECAALLKNLNWLYKPQENGGMVIVEKIENAPGVIEPLRKLRTKTAFTFYITMKSSNLLYQMKPFDQVAAFDLPAGQTVKLYFDNLVNNNIDPQQELSSTGEVGQEDLSTFFSNNFTWQKNYDDTKKLLVDEITDGGGYSDNFAFQGTATTAQIALEDGTYLFTERRANNSKLADYTLNVNTRLLQTKAIGLIRIFKDELTDYDKAAAIDYEITMKKIV